MLDNRRVVVVMPALNAAKTIERTYNELPHAVVDRVILTDDGSSDTTVRQAKRLGIHTIVHENNRGYGANQKTCYRAALEWGADIVVMVHPDYQYSPKLVTAMASMIASGHYDLVLASRILGGRSAASGMPLYKYVGNRFLTATQNILCGAKLSEYHTGFRAYSSELLATLPFDRNDDGFVFDNELLAQALHFGFSVGELSCPTRYDRDASSIRFWPAVHYGFGVLRTSAAFRLHRMGVVKSRLLVSTQ